MINFLLITERDKDGVVDFIPEAVFTTEKKANEFKRLYEQELDIRRKESVPSKPWYEEKTREDRSNNIEQEYRIKGAIAMKNLIIMPILVDEEFTPKFMESFQRASKIKSILDSEQPTKK